ncbi:hypothetical protein F4X90_21495, partial [Candidatus Poribacteria bacterium]|nr:hypothetical protein [Candidatus Poribacteria bacterium]
MQDIENTLKTHIQNDQAHTFVVIVPTDSARLHRQRELVGYHPNRAVADLRVYTLGSFIQRLYDQVHPAKSYISQGIQNLWLHEIANPQSDNTDVHLYNTFRPNPNISVPDSTLSLIADKINHLKERGETAENIIADNPTKIDLARIYSDYEAKLTNDWIDEHGKHLYLANEFKSEFMRNAFPRVNLVIVEGFTVLSKADTKILTRVAKMPNIETWFRTDYVPENQALYKNIGDLVSQFKEANATIDPDYEREPDQHQRFAKNLFQTETAGSETSVNDLDTASQIKMLRPADRSNEVEQIAYLIQKRVSQGPCKLSDICVAYYNIGQYQQRIAETFPAYDIPYSLAESLPLTKSEIVKSIFSRLSSQRVPIADAYFSDVPSAADTRIFHPDAFQRYIDGLLADGKVVEHILNPMFRENQEVVEGEIEAYRQFRRIIKELCSVLKAEGDGSYCLGDYIGKLHHIAKHTNYRNRATTKGETVKIAQLSELRSLEFDTVFLGDFVEGSFPENYRPDPLLPETPYRTEEEQRLDNRLLFYRVLKSFRKRLYLLVPKREREADLIPSPFLAQLRKVANVDDAEVGDPSRGSLTGFLSIYGNYIWTVGATSNGEFPDSIGNMRPLIDHVVAVEKSREETHKHLAYEGVLTVGTLSVESQKQLQSLHNKPYSVTELETYAKCPFQYFVNNILRFRVEEDEEEDELSSLERGSLLHEILFEFYNNHQKSPPVEQHFEAAKQQLDGILDAKSEERRNRRTENLISADNLFWETEIEKLRVALHKWLKAEQSYDLSVMPRYFEVSFGQDQEPRDPELSCPGPISIGNVRMRGKIDRIDLGNGAFNVIDYKTGGSTIRMPEILNGRSIQLPIYLQIAKQLLDNNRMAGLESASGLYHKIRLDECTVELGIGTKLQNGIAYK